MKESLCPLLTGTILYFACSVKKPNVIMPVRCKTRRYVSIKKQARDILIKTSVTVVANALKPAHMNRRGLISTRKIMLPLNATFAGEGQVAPFV
jgi:hypothetical protein